MNLDLILNKRERLFRKTATLLNPHTALSTTNDKSRQILSLTKKTHCKHPQNRNYKFKNNCARFLHPAAKKNVKTQNCRNAKTCLPATNNKVKQQFEKIKFGKRLLQHLLQQLPSVRKNLTELIARLIAEIIDLIVLVSPLKKTTRGKNERK